MGNYISQRGKEPVFFCKQIAMNNNKMFRVLLSVAIVIAFFLPWFKYGGSGLDIVIFKGAGEDTATMIVRYSFLLIPFFALIVAIRSINKQGSGFLLRLLPLLVTGILTTLFILGVKELGGGDEELKGVFHMLDYGLYISSIASLLLIFV
jgi:hypothetical protein